MILFLLIYSAPAIGFNGLGFMTGITWNLGNLYGDPVTVRGFTVPNGADYGILVFVTGTLVSSFLAILIALPLSVGAAIFLREAVPQRLAPSSRCWWNWLPSCLRWCSASGASPC